MHKLTQLFSNDDLRAFLSMKYAHKLALSRMRITEFIRGCDGKAFISYSHGRDSIVLRHLVHSIDRSIPCVFVSTGVQFPEVVQFTRDDPNVVVLHPKLTFGQVCQTYGFPVVSKEVSQKLHEIRTTKSDKLLHLRLHGRGDAYRSGKLPNKWHFLIDAPFKVSHKCCDVLKKRPLHRYIRRSDRRAIIGLRAEESHARRQSFMRYGCNVWRKTGNKTSECRPLMTWSMADVKRYVIEHSLELPATYAMGWTQTGCVHCAFGAHMEVSPNRFERLALTHPKLHKRCMGPLRMKEVLDFMGIPTGV